MYMNVFQHNFLRCIRLLIPVFLWLILLLLLYIARNDEDKDNQSINIEDCEGLPQRYERG